jgi:polar amino acid transport system substrate-binding protein
MPGVLRLAACIGVLFTVTAARADTLDQVRQRGTLRWGGDQEGGGPYMFPDPDNPNKLIGFEVDLMDRLASRIGVKARFVQGEWKLLLDMLRRGDIDVVCNGYELTPTRAQQFLATMPYYVYELQLITRRDDPSIRGWDDFTKPGAPRRKIGVMTPTGAETYVRQRLGDAVQIVPYDGTTQALEDLQNHRIDATVQDVPAALFYKSRYARLHFVGPPVGRGYYVLYVRRGDQRLRDALNTALLDATHSPLRAVYERYGIWNPPQEQLGTPGLGQEVTPPGGAEAGAEEPAPEVHGWEIVGRHLTLLLAAAGITVVLTCLSMPLAMLLGLLAALGRLYGPAPLRAVLAAYVEVLRGTPLLLQLYTIYFVLPPAFGISLGPFTAAILGLAINYSAYEAENYRAGLLAIPIGQMEAALALGMSRLTALRRVIVPQAVRIVIPPVTNDFIALFKDTSICSIITVVELTKEYQILVNDTGAYLELAAVTALLYLLMSYPLSLLARRLERRFPRLAV